MPRRAPGGGSEHVAGEYFLEIGVIFGGVLASTRDVAALGLDSLVQLPGKEVTQFDEAHGVVLSDKGWRGLPPGKGGEEGGRQTIWARRTVNIFPVLRCSKRVFVMLRLSFAYSLT